MINDSGSNDSHKQDCSEECGHSGDDPVDALSTQKESGKANSEKDRQPHRYGQNVLARILVPLNRGSVQRRQVSGQEHTLDIGAEICRNPDAENNVVQPPAENVAQGKDCKAKGQSDTEQLQQLRKQDPETESKFPCVVEQQLQRRIKRQHKTAREGQRCTGDIVPQIVFHVCFTPSIIHRGMISRQHDHFITK